MRFMNFIKRTYVELYKSIKRFPVTIALSTAVIITLIMISEIQFRGSYDTPTIKTLTRLSMVFALGIPLSPCIKLLFEKHQQISILFKTLIYALAAGALAGYYFYLLKDIQMVSTVRYIALSFALYLSFLFIPYLHKKEDFEMYIIKIITRFFTTVVYSAVLFLGLAAILFTVDKLLNIHVESKTYYYTWLFIAGLFSPIFFLAGVPNSNESLSDYDYPNFFKILLLYIVMPLLTIYLAILYIYFAKIIITSIWPIGLVSHLVLWYSTLCAAVIFLITPIKNNIWVDKFIFFLPKLILPILVMMFISMGIRINAYGITENRYFVMILGLWVFCIMGYISFRKVRRNIILPISLSIIAMISVFGPVSSFSVSKFSQNNRLSEILTRNSMLSSNGAITPNSNISEKDKTEVSAILRYFENNHNLDDVKYLDKSFALADMDKVFGFQYKDPWQNGTNQNYFSYNSAHAIVDTLDISGYDTLFNMSTYKNAITRDPLRVEYVSQSNEVNIYNGNNVIYNFKMIPFVNQLRAKYPVSNSVDQQDMIFVDENASVKVQFIFSNIYGQRTEDQSTIRIDGADFYILLKLKP